MGPNETTMAMKKKLTIVLLLILSLNLFAQPDKIGLGLAFNTGLVFNTQKTGNPAFLIKTWINLDKDRNFYLVPSLSVYNRYRFSNGYFVVRNYMFHGDLDGQFRIYEEKTLKVIGFAGGNFMYLNSDFETLIATSGATLADLQDYAVGGNAGLGLEMRMSSYFDFHLTGKLTLSKSLTTDELYKQAIISVQAVYYFRSRRIGAWY